MGTIPHGTTKPPKSPAYLEKKDTGYLAVCPACNVRHKHNDRFIGSMREIELVRCSACASKKSVTGLRGI